MSTFDLTSESGLIQYLRAGPFKGSHHAVRLSGGFSAFVYRVQTEPLDDGTTSIIVKHVQKYAAGLPTLQLAQSRLVRMPLLSPENISSMQIGL